MHWLGGRGFESRSTMLLLSYLSHEPSPLMWKGINSNFKKRKHPAAVNQRSARRWRRRYSSANDLRKHRCLQPSIRQSILGDDGQNAWVAVHICGYGMMYTQRRKMVRTKKVWLNGWRHLVRNVERIICNWPRIHNTELLTCTLPNRIKIYCGR